MMEGASDSVTGDNEMDGNDEVEGGAEGLLEYEGKDVGELSHGPLQQYSQ
jgi:hypothetical protein